MSSNSTPHTPYRVPNASNRDELVIEHSRFIGILTNVASVETAKQALSAIRREFPDAGHHVYAYRVGHGNSVIDGMSDDGEPSGTAGPPIMAVLRGSDLGDILIVVTRYFGGRKLGTGGLVRAYTDTARLVMKSASLELKVTTVTLAMNVPYSHYTQIKRLFPQFDGIIIEEIFSADISMTVRMPEAGYAAFVKTIRDLSAGNIVPVRFDSSG